MKLYKNLDCSFLEMYLQALTAVYNKSLPHFKHFLIEIKDL